MKVLNDDIKIAFSLQSSPGVYALLLGSGISRSAGIPTGWEVVLDLIKKVAQIEGESSLTDPEKWYIEKYGEPDYAKLLDILANTPAERARLLRQYFEPDQHDLEEGLKVPTQAHRSIAKLVKYGYVRMILTTNFDRLIEKAIEGEGITPVVISTDDSMEGAMPYIHNQCTIVKLHGDYMDTRIKNTPEELANYSEALNKYLDRIFDEFGLIICGWSAEWDESLRKALYRRKNRRFSTYWTVRGKMGNEATRLVTHLKAENMSIIGADEFFSTLSDNVEALTDFGASHPLSTDLAVAKVKKYLSEEKYSIKLHDLVIKELDRVCLELSSDRFETEPQLELTPEFYIKRIHEYEELMNTLIRISTTLVYFDNDRCSSLIKRIIERILQTQKFVGSRYLINLQRYPVLLLFNSIGLISIDSNNYNTLATVLLKTRYDGYSSHYDEKKSTLIDEFYTSQILKDFKKTELSQPENYIVKTIKNYVMEYLPDDKKYEDTFDIFEYLIYLMYIDSKYKAPLSEEICAEGYRLAKKYYNSFYSDRKPEFIYDFIQEGLKEGKEWSLLKAGFFDGSPGRLEECFNAYKKYLEDWGRSIH